ncbi:acylneuraminate cytidylyltransferase, partial [Campylobacter coli]|nr:acylneuraminate cytidylyltransferase [Campylobacter coli]
MSKNKYIAEIPARLGSQRVRQKNLRLIEGEPMIA